MVSITSQTLLLRLPPSLFIDLDVIAIEFCGINDDFSLSWYGLSNTISSSTISLHNESRRVRRRKKVTKKQPPIVRIIIESIFSLFCFYCYYQFRDLYRFVVVKSSLFKIFFKWGKNLILQKRSILFYKMQLSVHLSCWVCAQVGFSPLIQYDKVRTTHGKGLIYITYSVLSVIAFWNYML